MPPRSKPMPRSRKRATFVGAKKKTSKKRNLQDATLRNVRASRMRETYTTARLLGLIEAVTRLTDTIGKIEHRVSVMETWQKTHDQEGPWLKKSDL